MAFLARRTRLGVSYITGRKLPFEIAHAPRLAFGELPTPPALNNDPVTGWHKKGRRPGAVAIKLGMTKDWDDVGQVYPLTVLHIPSCQVVQVKTEEGEGKFALQIGSGDVKLKHLTRPLMGHFARAEIPPKKKLMEFDVTKDCLLPVGTSIYAQHYIPGMHINVQGITKGKGFQGAMKRWGFAGQPATHGVSLTHRSIGSTGNRQTPGRVFKGKKMAGHMGVKTRTCVNMMVFKVDPYLNLVFVKGCVPGPKNGWVKITDTPNQTYMDETPPYPTYIPKPGEAVPLEIRYTHENLPSRLQFNEVKTDPNHLILERWAQLGPTKSQIERHTRPQTMSDLVKAALEKRKKEKDAIATRQQLEKQKMKKIVKAAKKKVEIDDD